MTKENEAKDDQLEQGRTGKKEVQKNTDGVAGASVAKNLDSRKATIYCEYVPKHTSR
jgi:hypothetical protein